MNVLITNDDGIMAEGIIELAKSMMSIANVYIVAPDSQRSATGHAITIHNPIMAKEVFIDKKIKAYAISGTPADCVKIGIEALFKNVDIDLVLSGINNGANLGTDVVYSGTVSAAIEGLIQNKPSIAISYNEFNVSKEIYKNASLNVVKIIQKLSEHMELFDDCVLNINIPNKEIKGSKVTILGERKYENAIQERVSPHGQKYFWVGGKIKELQQEDNSDIIAVEEGFISITPINIDMTNKNKINILKKIL